MSLESLRRALGNKKAAERASRAMDTANCLIVATGWHGVPERVLNRIRTDEYLGLPVSDEDKRLARAIIELQVAKEYFFRVWRDYYATPPADKQREER